MCPTAHIEPANSPIDSINYCTKEHTRVDGPWEEGQRPIFG